MALTQRISAAVLAASSAVLLALPAHAQTPAPSAPTTRAHGTADNSVSDPVALVDRDLADLYTRLNRPSPDPGAPDEVGVQESREDAARRLVSRHSPRANKDLGEALRATASRNAREIKLAVARAISDEPDPDPIFISALIPLLQSDRAIAPAERRAQIALGDASAMALARYGSNEVARDALLKMAQNLAQPVPARAGVIRALATLVSRDVADVLVALVSDPRQPQPIQEAAGDALAELTRLPGDSHDPARWKQWQVANAAKPETVWRADLLAARQARMENEDHLQSGQIDELKRILGEQYQKADREQKFAMVMRLLNSSDPQTRIMGIQMVETAHDNATAFPPQAPSRLEELIGDSDPYVRLAAAQAIQSLNDTDAVGAILTQIPQETVLSIKLAQIAALEPMKKLRAVPELRFLLHDPSLLTATAAVHALRTPGLLPTDNPALAREVADELLRVGAQRQGEPNGVEFRGECLKAAAAVYANAGLRTTAPDATRAIARDLLSLLSQQTDPRLRSAALQALGDLGDPVTSDPIARWLQLEPVASVRLDAIKALGGASTFEDAAETLNNFMSPNTEPDKSVRDEAWQQFQALVPKATKVEVLNRWASEFQNDPSRQLQVQLALNNKLQQAGTVQEEQLAYAQQNTGQTYLRLGDPAHAALQFAAALDYWQKHIAANQVTEHLIDQLMKADLAARNYTRAVDLAARQLSDPRMQTLVGPIIRDTAERLKNEGAQENDAQKLKDAATLIDAALKMQPPLAEHYQTDLREFQQEIAQRLKAMRK